MQLRRSAPKSIKFQHAWVAEPADARDLKSLLGLFGWITTESDTVLQTVWILGEVEFGKPVTYTQ